MTEEFFDAVNNPSNAHSLDRNQRLILVPKAVRFGLVFTSLW